MNQINLVTAKLKKLSQNIHIMTEEERTDALKFLVEVQQNQVDRMLNVCESQDDYIKYLERKREHLENFIRDNGLQKRFDFYSKGVI